MEGTGRSLELREKLGNFSRALSALGRTLAVVPSFFIFPSY